MITGRCGTPSTFVFFLKKFMMQDPEKQRLRETLRARRDDVDRSHIDLSRAVADTILWLGKLLPSPRVIALYMAIRSETDTTTLAQALVAQGRYQLALPVVVERDQPLRFRRWQPGDRLAIGRMGIPEPLPEAEALTPDLVFAPLLGFDSAGNRLGYGRGDYDRTLAALRKENPALRAIGLAFAAQEADRIPAHDGDEPLDAVLTEHGLRFFRSLA